MTALRASTISGINAAHNDLLPNLFRLESANFSRFKGELIWPHFTVTIAACKARTLGHSVRYCHHQVLLCYVACETAEETTKIATNGTIQG